MQRKPGADLIGCNRETIDHTTCRHHYARVWHHGDGHFVLVRQYFAEPAHTAGNGEDRSQYT
jgi:hypothetical protein